MRKTRTIVAIASVALIILSTVGVWWYYTSYPSEFQVNGRFSTSGIDISERFESSSMSGISSLLLTNFREDDDFNVSIAANRGWQATRLTVYNASQRTYTIIYDTILFDTNGSVSLEINRPFYVFLKPENFSISISTGKVDSAFFIASGGTSLVMENVTTATGILPLTNPIVEFQVVGGNISVLDSSLLFRLDNNNNDIVLVRLETHVSISPEIVINGKFGIQCNAFSSVTFDFWTSPLTSYFKFVDGFLSCNGRVSQLSGSQDLNLTRFRGEVTLSGSEAPYEISLKGYSKRIFVGTSDITSPDIFRDFLQLPMPIFALVGSIIIPVVTVVVSIWAVKRVKPKLDVQVLNCEHGIRRDGGAFLLRLIFRVHNKGDKNTTLTELEVLFRDGQGNPKHMIESLKVDVEAGKSTENLEAVYSFTPPFPYSPKFRCSFVLRHTYDEYSFTAYSTQSATNIDKGGFFI